MASSKRISKLSAIGRTAFRYGLPFLTVFAALLIQGTIQHLAPTRTDFPYAFLYLIAAFVSAWYGGYVAGALTCLFVMVGLPFSALHFSKLPPIDFTRLLPFLGVSLLISRVAQTQRRAREVLRTANDELDKRVQARTSELAAAMEQLQEQKTLLQTTFDSIGEGIIVTNEHGKVLLSNPAAERILRKGPAQAGREMWSELYDVLQPDKVTPFPSAELPLTRAIRGEATDDIVMLARAVSPAQERWLSVSGRPLCLPDGSLRGGLAVFTDITERKRAMEALVESQERYRSLAELLPHLVWTCNIDGSCDYLSRQWVEYTGRSAEQQLGYGWADSLHNEDRPAILAAWTQAASQGRPFDLELRLRRYDGVYRWFKTRAVPLRDAAGGIVKWFGSSTDFEDYKRGEQKLQDQLQRLNLLDQITHAIAERQDLRSIFQVVVRSLEESLPIDFGCVCLHDPALNALTVTCVGVRNEGLARELTMTEQSRIAVGQNGLARCVRGELVYEPDTSELDFPFPRRLSDNGLRAVVIAPLSSESGVFGILVAARREPNSFSSGDCEFLRQLSQHVALAAHQMEIYTALQQAYDELRQTQQAVLQQERLRALGQMASGIAHDINNALSPAALYTESLLEREPNLSTRAREYLETIQRAVDDVAQTVGRMREFYRQREPQMMLQPADLNRLVTEVLNLSRARWSDMPQQRGIAITVRTDLAVDLPTVGGVDSEIREALVNLVFNAVDAMPDGGTLTLRTKATRLGTDVRAAQSVCVEVEDTGVGMDEETRRRCLEPFFTTKGERGTGLGLAMVYGMAQRLSAELEIVSASGRGTTMRLRFPAAPAVAEPAKEAYSPAQLARLRILVVDDDPLILKSLRDTLERDAHIVTTAQGGQEGIDMWRLAEKGDNPFAVVITDLGMPNIDGRKVAMAVKTTSPETPVILLTGWGQRMEAEQDLPAHVDRVLNKPPKMHELRTALKDLTANGSLNACVGIKG